MEWPANGTTENGSGVREANHITSQPASSTVSLFRERHDTHTNQVCPAVVQKRKLHREPLVHPAAVARSEPARGRRGAHSALSRPHTAGPPLLPRLLADCQCEDLHLVGHLSLQ